IVYCRRNARDTALSLWSQSFLEDVQGYAYDFADIAMVMRDSERLMELWHKHYADAIREVRYEQLTHDPDGVIAALCAWIGLAPGTWSAGAAKPATSISTASLWQARQPVYTRSVARWRNYAEFVPELLKFSAD